MKKKIFVVLCCVIAIAFTGCRGPIDRLRDPERFIGACWSTKDGSIQFSVYEDYQSIYTCPTCENRPFSIQAHMFGTITVDNTKYDVYVSISPDWDICFASTNIQHHTNISEACDHFVETEYMLAIMRMDLVSQRTFVGTVEWSEFHPNSLFPDGTEFEFFRQDAGD